MPLPIKPQPSTPTRWMSANSSAPGFGLRGGRSLEGFAYFFGDAGEGLRRPRQDALAGRANVAALEPVEDLLECELQALVCATVGARDHRASRRQPDRRHEHQIGR